MAHGHIKEVELWKGGITYSLEIDSEDPENLVIESVTIVGTRNPRDNEKDVDPTVFESELDDDDWITIKEKLG